MRGDWRMIRNRCFIDTETYCSVPISLGTDLYTRSAACMIVTYCIDDEPVFCWEPWLGDSDPLPDRLRAAIMDPACYFVAHNAVFDRLILKRALRIDIPVNRWWCTRAQAYAHGLPGSLEMLGRVLQLPQGKQKLIEDGQLIHTFCIPQAATGMRIWPSQNREAWRRFRDYAVRDTEALREEYKRLPQHNFNESMIELWHLDQLINRRGFQFDDVFAKAAVEFLTDAKHTSDTHVARLTDSEVHAVTQRARLLAYLKRNIDIESLRAAEVREWLESDDLNPATRLLLEERLEAAKSSGAKYARGLSMMSPDRRQRDTQQFNGAGRTGRDTGRGFQPYNMPRPVMRITNPDNGRIEQTAVKATYIDDIIVPGIYDRRALNNPLVYGGPYEAAAACMRQTITATPGNELVVGDWKNIESVIVAWCAGETGELTAFADAFQDPTNKSKDVYRIQFSQFFGIPVEEVDDVGRQGGKVSKLAFGFGGGVGALVVMAATYQIDLEPLAEMVLPRATPEQLAKAYKAWRRAFLRAEDYDLEPRVYQAADVLKQVYRKANANINQFRRDVGNAVKESVERPNEAVFRVGRCLIWCNGAALIIELPSGRRLLYASPRIEKEIIPDPDGGPPSVYDVFTYMTARGKSWRRERGWDGMTVENIVQAIANDVLRATKLSVHADTLRVPAIASYLKTLPEDERTAIVLCIYDEIVLDVPVGSYPTSRLLERMCEPKRRQDGVIWSEGLPLHADLWTNFRYGKR